MRARLQRVFEISSHFQRRTGGPRLAAFGLCLIGCLALTSCSELTVPVELDTLLIKEGDLPAGLRGGPPLNDLKVFVPAPQKTVSRRFQKEGRPAGFVQVSLFETPEQATQALDHGAKELAATTTIDFRDGGFTRFNGNYEGQVIFRQCRGVALIDMRGMKEASELKNYADRLAQRIEGHLCPPPPK